MSPPDTAEFKSWFGQSKVTGPDGGARCVFHGTRGIFDSFDRRRSGCNVDNPTTQMGPFFTEAPAGAERWTARRNRTVKSFAFEEVAGAPLVMPVFLSIQKPKIIKADKFHYFLRTARAQTISNFCDETFESGFDGFRIEYAGAADSGDDSRPSEVWWVPFGRGAIKSPFGSGIFDAGSEDMFDRHGWAQQADVDVEADEPRERMRA